MWRSVGPGENFRRSIRLEQSDRTCWTIQTHSEELNWASRRTFHEINLLRLVRLTKSSTFGLGLKVPAYVQRKAKKCSRSAIHKQPVFLFTCIVCFNVVDAFAVLGPVHTIIRIFFRKSILCLHESAFRQHKSSEVPFPETVKARPHESG